MPRIETGSQACTLGALPLKDKAHGPKSEHTLYHSTQKTRNQSIPSHKGIVLLYLHNSKTHINCSYSKASWSGQAGDELKWLSEASEKNPPVTTNSERFKKRNQESLVKKNTGRNLEWELNRILRNQEGTTKWEGNPENWGQSDRKRGHDMMQVLEWIWGQRGKRERDTHKTWNALCLLAWGFLPPLCLFGPTFSSSFSQISDCFPPF